MGLPKFSRVALITLLAVLAALAACSDDPAPARAPLEIVVQPELRGFVDDFVEFLPYPNIVVREAADPVAELSSAPVDDRPCADECFVLERAQGGFVVHGAKPLGLQYGLAHLLELAGVRFYHPWRTHVPDVLAIASDAERRSSQDVVGSHVGDPRGVLLEPVTHVSPMQQCESRTHG